MSKLLFLELQNYKKFPKITIPMDRDSLLICGPNGSGKSQLLWAMILYFCAHNLHYRQSARFHGRLRTEEDSQRKFFDLRGEGDELLGLSTQGMENFSSFINEYKEGHINRATLKGIYDDNTVIEIPLRVNGVLSLHPDERIEVPGKYQFAYTGHEFRFTFLPEDRVYPITSHFGHIRYCYDNLEDSQKRAIVDHMKDLFKNLKNITINRKIKGPARIMVEEDHTSLEIRYTGSAFQKLFATFTLLYTLIAPQYSDNGQTEPCRDRYFLMEDPEALLHPSLLEPFFNTVTDICTANSVKLCVVSNSEYLFQRMNAVFTLPLNNDDPQEVARQLGLHLDQKFLIVDRKNDAQFIRKFTDWGGKCAIMVKQELETEKQNVLYSPWNFAYDRLCFLHDAEFMPPSITTELNQRFDTATRKEIYWEVPCVESFFIWNDLKKDFPNRKETLQAYFKNSLSGNNYFNGLHHALFNHKDCKSPEENLFARAVLEVEKEENRDCLLITRVIHGHTFVQSYMKTDTDKLIEETSMEQFDSEIKESILKILTKIEIFLGID